MNQKKKILIFSLTFLLIFLITIFTLLPEFLTNFQIKDFKPQAKDVSNLKVDNPEINTQDITHKLSLNSLNPFQVKTILAQTSPTGPLFIKTIGETGEDWSGSIQQTSDGGYVITGYTLSFGAGNYDVFVIKLDSSGNLSWAKTIGGTGNDYGRSIRQTSDGGYVITGYTYSFGAGDSGLFVIKLDSSGNLSWAKTVGGTNEDRGYSIQQTSDEGYIITGETWRFGAGNYDVFVIKLDSSGNLSWAKTIGGTNEDRGYSIQQTSDEGYIITGETWSFGAGYSDVFVIKLDSSGNLSWARAIGGEGWDFGRSIQQTSDGGYVITGYTLRFGAGDYDVFVIKLDSSGNLSWAKTIGGKLGDSGNSIQQTSDGGYVITGYTYSFGAEFSDVLVIKLDSSGNLSWAKAIVRGSPDYGSSIQQTSDGGYIITGSTGFHGVYIITGSTGFPGTVFGAEFSDVFVIKLDSSGNIPGCSYISSTSPTIQSISPSVASVSPTLTSVTPSISSVSPSISNVSPTVDSVCGPSISTPTLRPTPTPTPTLTLTPTPTPTPISTPLTPTSTPTSTPTPIPTPIGRTGYNVWGWIWSEREALIFILVVAILIIGGVLLVKIFKLKKVKK